MGRYKVHLFGLVSRPLKSATVWYYYHYLDGERSGLKSTGIGYTNLKDRAKSRREAEAYCQQLLESGHIEKQITKIPTLQEFVDEKNFWDWHLSGYIRGILSRSEEGRQGITKSYVNTAAQITRDHILPAHGSARLDKISVGMIEALLFSWAGTNSHKSANNWRSVYSVILGEAARLGYIEDNPWKKVPSLMPKKKVRGGFTISEVAKILSLESNDTLSESGKRYYLAMKIAFLTGLRIGEIRGLFTDDVVDVEYQGRILTYLSVTKQQNSHGNELTSTKDKDSRNVPITRELRKELSPYLTGPGRYLLSIHPKQETAIAEGRIRIWFYNRVELAGIQTKDREARGITFHSTRRFFNTLLRQAGVSDDVIRKFTGHDNQQMTDHYTDYLPQDMDAISTAQKRLMLN